MLTLRRETFFAIPAITALSLCLLVAAAAAEPSTPAEATTSDASDLELTALDDIELFDLTVPEVVFAAGRHEQTVASLPYAISVITAEDLRRAGVQSVPDALRLVPGVSVSDFSAGKSRASLRGLHGILSRESLVLVDGRQIFDGFFGGTVWEGWPFMIEDIERIEVIRGPAGLTWGPNAVNGVINIITKKPADEPTLVLRASGGTQGWNRDYLGYSFTDERLSFRISGEFERSDGHQRGGTPLAKIDDDFLAARMSIRGAYQLTERDKLRFDAGSTALDGGTPGAPIFIQQRGRIQSNYVMFEWQRTVSRDESFTWTGYVNDFHNVWGIASADYRYQQGAVQFTHTFVPTPAHTITWGFDTRMEYMNSSGSSPSLHNQPFTTSGTFGLYLQDECKLAEDWILNIGARIDYGTYSGFDPSARVGLIYVIDDHQSAFAAVSRAVHVAPASYSFLDSPILGRLSRMGAKPLLSSQPVIAYELGYRGRWLEDRLDVAAAVFWNEYTDVTSLIPHPFQHALLSLTIENAAATSIYGAELEADYELAEDWRLLSHYTYMQMDWHSYTTTPVARDVISAPRHQFMVGIQHDLTDDLHLSANWYFVDDTTSPSQRNLLKGADLPEYHRLDLTCIYEFWEDRAAITVGVKNLLDNQHPEGGSLVMNETEVPRMIFGELRLSLP